MNGNDIVDLGIAGIPTGLKQSRFFDKIFSIDEQEFINKDRVGVWSLWAMKEAIYKAHHRRFNLPRNFDPKGIKVYIIDAKADSIIAGGEYLGHDYFGTGCLTLDFVHFTATCHPRVPLYIEIFKNSSIEIKPQIKQAISEKLGLEIMDIDIVKDENNIPQMLYKKIDLNIPFSISHHGNFKAFSFQLMNY